MKDHVLSQHVGDDKPTRIDDLNGQLIVTIDPDGNTVVKSTDKPTQLPLFKGDTGNESGHRTTL